MHSPEHTGGVRIVVGEASFSYGSESVLRSVSITVEPGEIVGVLGPNGSGKTTLLKIISGVLQGYSGSVSVDGREVRDIGPRELARRVAVVPQETETGLPFTATEVVLMGRHAHMKGLAFESELDVKIAKSALEQTGASHLASRNIQRLSSGERQRVIFARALAQEPGAILLDEPTSFLDIRYQVEIYDLVRQLVSEKRLAAFTALHDLNLAAEYCDRIYLLKEGRVFAEGATDDVLTYANLTAVFESDVYVDTNDLTGKLLVIPLSHRAKEKLKRERREPIR
ncbi:ABC transporter ATP-binding protein [Candidatus Zixiibacteriota bacterium]